jgi:UDP-N-acetylmuramate: L-alanyl-gamma-D-glutamyl-meso-diaminopimelate ligase
MQQKPEQKRVHFIAVGGAVMHNLAIVLKNNGFIVTGSDDEIFEPSRSRLAAHGLLPGRAGWNPDCITSNIDFIILGMHAGKDNPELLKALELGIKIYSFPEYIYEVTRDKKRVVISGSHGKTTITAMIMHTLNYHKFSLDYLVGAKVEGLGNMVGLSDDSGVAVLEGDEYPSSALDATPKFHYYKPHIALVSGIAWDHINVYPEYEKYVEQFYTFIQKIEDKGILIYFENDNRLKDIVKNFKGKIKTISYSAHPFVNEGGIVNLLYGNKKIPLKIFGEHNMQNLNGARLVCNQLGIHDVQFYEAITTFKGASKRLQLIESNDYTDIYIDFAHSPSKLEATIKAVKNHYPDRKLAACMELHTYSSLNKNYLSNYNGTMDLADIPIVYFSPETLKHKRLEMLSKKEVKDAFGLGRLKVFVNPQKLSEELLSMDWRNKNLLLMSSGDFSGIDINNIANQIINY